MKFSQVLLTIVLAAFISWSVGHFQKPARIENKAESTLDRVVRTGTIRCGYFSWPPYVMKDPNTGGLSGINVDIMEAIAGFLQLKLEWMVETSNGNYIEELNNDRFDLMCASVWPDAGRTKNSLLSHPTLYSGVYMIVRADDNRFKDPQELNKPDIKLAGIEGDFTASTAANDFSKAKIFLLPSSSDASNLLISVETGKADATFGDLGFFNDYNTKNPGKVKILSYDQPVLVAGENLAMKKGEFAFKAVLDTTITELTNNGKIASLVAKYKGGSMMAPKVTYNK